MIKNVFSLQSRPVSEVEKSGIVYQSFGNLKKDKNFFKKIVCVSLLFPVPVLNVFSLLYLFGFIEDSLANRKTKLPELSAVNLKYINQNSSAVITMLVYFGLVCALKIFLDSELIFDLLMFFLAPSAVFSTVLYAYTRDDHSFFNLRKVIIFWEYNWEQLIIPSGTFLLSVLIAAKSAYLCLSFLVVLSSIYLINFTVNSFDERLYSD